MRPFIYKKVVLLNLLLAIAYIKISTIWISLIRQNSFLHIKLIMKRKQLHLILILHRFDVLLWVNGFIQVGLSMISHLFIASGFYVYLDHVSTCLEFNCVFNILCLFRTFFEFSTSDDRVFLCMNVDGGLIHRCEYVLNSYLITSFVFRNGRFDLRKRYFQGLYFID